MLAQNLLTPKLCCTVMDEEALSLASALLTPQPVPASIIPLAQRLISSGGISPITR